MTTVGGIIETRLVGPLACDFTVRSIKEKCLSPCGVARIESGKRQERP